jgi:serine/threonine protein kinase
VDTRWDQSVIARSPRAGPPSIPATFDGLEHAPVDSAISADGGGAPTGARAGARYTVLAELARGGLGRVLAAVDETLGRPVAIKEPIGSGAETWARLIREARLTARLQHPGVVTVHDLGAWQDGRPFFVMSLVAGRSLAELVCETRSADLRLGLLGPVLAAAETVGHAHRHGIVHRDLKPANVIVGENGTTVVVDWGLACELDAPAGTPADPDVTDVDGNGAASQAGRVVGTPPFMPPEQAAGAPVDQRADVYALGAMAYNVLSGEQPYSGLATSDVLEHVQRAPPVPLRWLAPGTPHQVIALIERAMAREPWRRPPSAGGFARALRTVLADLGFR